MLEVIRAHAVKNLCYISARKMSPKGIVVHSTGANNPNLKRYVDAPDKVGKNLFKNHWNMAKPGGRKVCVHAFIGYDINKQIKVAEILPLDICAWGVGSGKKGSYNYDPAHIQFEICEDNLKDKEYYKKAFAVAAEYCAELCKTYGFGVDKIVGHNEAYKKGYASNHADPEHWMKKFGESMNDFRNRVSLLLKAEDTKDKNNTSSFKKGDLVALSSNAVYYSGAAVPLWVKSQNWYIKETPKGDRVVIDKNESGTNAICSPIDKKYLTVIKTAKKDSQKEENKSVCPYLVKVTTIPLIIRKGAGANTAKAGSITDNGVYTIVEEKKDSKENLWGRLKSGAGWILLSCVKKV